MSALMTPRPAAARPPHATRHAAPGGQSALFGAGSARRPRPRRARAHRAGAAAERAAAVAAPEAATTARAHRHGPTLDDLVAGAWEGLLAGAPADCLVVRHAAGAAPLGRRRDRGRPLRRLRHDRQLTRAGGLAAVH